MRKKLHAKMKEYIREEFLKARGSKTQEEMASALSMSLRSYSDLERGKTCCSLMTLLLYLIRCCPDREAFLNGLFEILDESEKTAA